MDYAIQNEANKNDSQHSAFTGFCKKASVTFDGPYAGQNPSQTFFNDVKNRQSHSWHSGFDRFFAKSFHFGEHKLKSSNISTESQEDIVAFPSPDKLVKTFASLTPPEFFSRDNFCANRSPTFIKPHTKSDHLRNSSSFLTRLSQEMNTGPQTNHDSLHPMFSPRMTSTPVVSPYREHSFVSPLPSTPRHMENSYVSSRGQRLGRRRLLFPSEDEEAVYYLITKYLLTMNELYNVY